MLSSFWKAQVYSCAPKGNPNYTFRESIPLGVTSISQQQVHSAFPSCASLEARRVPAAHTNAPRVFVQFRRSIEGLQDEWQGWTYDLLSRNCNHFCESLVEILGVGPLPGAGLKSAATSPRSRPLRPDTPSYSLLFIYFSDSARHRRSLGEPLRSERRLRFGDFTNRPNRGAWPSQEYK